MPVRSVSIRPAVATTPTCLATLAAALVAVAPPPLAAQGGAPATGRAALPAIRPIGPVTRVSAAGALQSVSTVRPLPGGRVLVNDMLGRKVVLLDSTLAVATVVADTTAATGNAYAGPLVGMLPHRGDSTLVVDPQSLSMLLVNGGGEVARVMAVPRADEAMFLVSSAFGQPGVDPRNRIVYRGFARPDFRMAPPEPGKPITLPQLPDSAPVLRVQLGTRALDTLAWLRAMVPGNVRATPDGKGGMSVSMTMNPLQLLDEWALLPDGGIAIVRGADYHVDWIAPDGTRRSTGKVPFEWVRLTDADKQKLVDSAKVALEAARTRGMAMLATGGAAAQRPAGTPPPGAAPVVIARVEPAAGSAPPSNTPAPRPAAGAGGFPMPQIEFVPLSAMPDYRPAFEIGGIRADPAGNLWVRTTRRSDAGPIYDVIAPDGTLRDRVQLPARRALVGVGDGVAYLAVLDDAGARLEVAKLR